MEIQSYFKQSAVAALLTTVTGTVGLLGTRVVSNVPMHLSSAVSAGIAAGISTTASVLMIKNTSVVDQVKAYFPESRLDFEMLTLMTALFLSTVVLTPLTSRVLFKKPICWFGIFGYPTIAAACGTIAHLKFSKDT